MTLDESALSRTASQYPPSAIRGVFDRVAEQERLSGEPVVKLTVGEPDFDSPAHVIEAAMDSLRAGGTRYTPNTGIVELREAVARHYGQRWGRDVLPDNVMITAGGNEALLLAMSVILDPGDEVLVTDPAYPNYLGQAHLLKAQTVRIPLEPSDGFRLTAELVEPMISPRTKLLVLNSPSNPLGTVIAPQELEKLVELAERHGIYILSDEVYDRIIFGAQVGVQRVTSVAQVRPDFGRTLVVNSLSKSHAMTGWRLGFVIADARLVAPMPRLQEGIVGCLPEFVQRAAVAALDGPDASTQDMLARYERRRDRLIRGVTDLGLGYVRPDGAFYLFVDVRGTGLTSAEFTDRLLHEQRVAVVPGTAFGEAGEGFVRLSYAAGEETIDSALEGIGMFLASL
ncbi:pyridoxal phosphate-dependent aminotransferase [Nesterenkonia aerolata]|uniref:Aminotransferase n=1 Tax=Nesterenkonia aerolata TaxID=3074079 RepID=A0ABU2DTJ0_9MICC|nr:pyridoxal phosphate-dependent aminotransferase [Nesterenkonia sp. LY-0111]MDR8019600.1 pyridoxal phosphate-dependent aminotransferase [Nesterenkonia sp. LY-0111]